LLKPGKLNEEDWEIMRMHPEIGAEILSGSSSQTMQMAEVIALNHQERWDGSGYPKQLKGTEIPMEGRIAALCDVFDALLSERPYKKANTIEDAMEFIEKKSGVFFDPELVIAFKKALPKMQRIVERFKDNPEDAKDNLKIIRLIQHNAVKAS
jgi:putative two-component system response regulator